MVLVEEVVEEYQAKIVTLRMGVDNQIPLSDESGCSYPAIQSRMMGFDHQII
jgi:hypothetical protein